MLHLKVLSLLVLVYSVMPWQPLLHAETLSVSAKAQGAGDGSPGAPFGRISEALEAANRGDTIVIHAGTYALESSLWVAKPMVKLVGVTGEQPLILADEKVPAVVTVVADGVVLQDLRIQGGFYGVKLDVDRTKSTHGITIRHCQIGATAADCIKSYNADDLLIDSCKIGPSGAKQKDNAEGIDVVGPAGVTIRGCLIEDVATNGIYLKGGTRNGLIEKCLVRRCGNGGILLGQDTDEEYMRDHARNEAINCTARNNIVVDTGSAGLGTYSGKGVAFINNTLLDVARRLQAGFWVVTNDRNVPAEDVVFENNIVVIGGDRPAVFVKDAAGLPASDHNLFHATRGNLRFVREMSDEESLNRQWTFEQWRESAGQDAHSADADPKLDAGQYRPQTGSPAIGAGVSVKGLDEDYFGRKRSGSPWSIGAVAVGAGPATSP